MRMNFGYKEKWVGGKEACTTEDGGRFPEGMVGPRGSTFSLGWVRPDRGGAEGEGTSELARSLNDALKPKLYYAYDRYADAYLCTPT